MNNHPLKKYIHGLDGYKRERNLEKHTNENNEKKTIRVGIYVDKPYIYINSDGKLEGFTYELWKLCKHSLHHKYKFIENIHAPHPGEDKQSINPHGRSTKSFTQYLESIKSEYELLIYPLYPSVERSNYIDFTLPIGYDPMVIIHKPLYNYWDSIRKYLLFTILPFLALILILGIIFGNLLFYFDKSRGHKRAVLTTIASFFGEAGFLSERWGPDSRTFKNLKFRGLPMILLLFVVTYFFGLGMQALTTAKAVQLFSNTHFDINNLYGKTFILPKGMPKSTKEALTSNGAKIIEADKNHNLKRMVEEVRKKKYDGMILGQQKANFYKVRKAKEMTDMEITTLSKLSLTGLSFGLRKNSHDNFYDDLNDVILNLQNSPKLMQLCKIYFEKGERFMCGI